MAGFENGGRARAYQALRESEELHRATLSNISDAVFLTDDEGSFTFICPNVDVIFGYVPDEVQSMSRLSRLLGENLYDLGELTAKGEIRNVEREVTSKSGQRRTVLIHFKRVAIHGGTVLCTCRDVTELRATENELTATRLNLAHAARLALVGQLMASIVHEIQQPLASLDINLTRVLKILNNHERAADLAELRGIFDHIHTGSTAALEIIDRLRTLVRKRPLELRALDLNAVVNDVLPLVNGDAVRRGVVLRAELAPRLPAIHGDRVSLQHVLLDLIMNAMEAMDQNDGRERLLTVRTFCDNGGVAVAVSDTGRGVPVDQRSRLFEPFFTTKAEGIGLGLAIARSIAEAHGGQVSADEHSACGATFRLMLPVPQL